MQFIWGKQFEKQWKKLPYKVKNQLQKRLETFCVDQFDTSLNNHKLSGDYDDCRSINITGDYRLVYRMISSSQCLLYNVGTHSQLYE
jgi:addiction module RelE/StbE family toxin